MKLVFCSIIERIRVMLYYMIVIMHTYHTYLIMQRHQYNTIYQLLQHIFKKLNAIK